MKKCPYCAKEIQNDAKFCRYCKSNLTPAAPPGRPIHPETSGRAITSIASLSVGFLSLILGFSGFPGSSVFLLLLLPALILAVVFGHLSYSEINRSDGRLKGMRMATVGLTLGYCGVALGLLFAMSNFADLSRSRIAANQAVAVFSLKDLNEAAKTYATTYKMGFPPSIAALGPPRGGGAPYADAAGLMDKALASGKKSGYVFTYIPGERDAEGRVKAYSIHADPTSDSTGTDHYFTDQTGVIRADRVRPANEQSPPLAGP